MRPDDPTADFHPWKTPDLGQEFDHAKDRSTHPGERADAGRSDERRPDLPTAARSVAEQVDPTPERSKLSTIDKARSGLANFNRSARGEIATPELGRQRGSEQVKRTGQRLEIPPPRGAVRSSHVSDMARDDAGAMNDTVKRSLEKIKQAQMSMPQNEQQLNQERSSRDR